MDPKLLKEDGILGFSDEDAEKLAFNIYLDCQLSRDDPDAAFESVSDLEFDKEHFDDWIADYVATEAISTKYGKLINYEKEIKMVGNAMSKAAGAGINLLPGTDGYTTSAPRKKDGQYYTRATFAFSDGQAVRVFFYSPDKPEEKHKYPSNVVSFQIFLNKRDITASLVKGGGADYGPRQFGKIIGKLLERNSEKFLKKNAEIRAQKEEMENLDKEAAELDSQISSMTNEAQAAKERNVFLKRNHEVWKEKSEKAVTDRAKEEKRLKAQKALDESVVETEAGKEWVESGLKKFRGKKYDPDMSTKDAAKAIRDDIKAAQKSGQIIDAGGGTYSVTMEKFSMGSAVNVNLKKLPEGVELYSDTWKDFIKSGSQDNPDNRLRYSDTVKDTLSKLENIVNQYNRTEVSTEPDDYSSVSFYPHVGVDSGLEKSEREKIESEVDTGGEVETGISQEEMYQLISDEIKQLKADPDMPEFKLGLRVGKKKDGSAGKVTLDLKSADVPTLEALDYLKLAINNRVSAHTDNYSLNADKVEKFISETETEIIQESDGRQYKIFYVSPEPLVKVPGGHYGLSISGPGGTNFVESSITTAIKDEMVTRVEEIIRNRGEVVEKRFTPEEAQPIGDDEPTEPQQEQVTDTAIKQDDIPPEEKPPTGREIGQEYVDQDGVTKPVTHEIDGKKVSANLEAGYIHSAYIMDRKWINLPVEEKTTINEDDLSKAIAKSEEAYQIADDILEGNYDAQGSEKVDQLLDEIANVIEDEAKLNEVADYLTRLITAKFTVAQSVPA